MRETEREVMKEEKDRQESVSPRDPEGDAMEIQPRLLDLFGRAIQTLRDLIISCIALPDNHHTSSKEDKTSPPQRFQSQRRWQLTSDGLQIVILIRFLSVASLSSSFCFHFSEGLLSQLVG
jgi:hypothetical protein